MSRYHAEIEYADGQYYIRDIGSTTGTFIKIIDKVELAEVPQLFELGHDS